MHEKNIIIKTKDGNLDSRLFINSDMHAPTIIFYMETSKWKPTEEERESMEVVWMQVKGACEKLKEETNVQNEHIRKMLQEMSDRYYS